MARLACEDKLLQIYFLGLKIISTALAAPVRGNLVDANIINQVLKEFTPLIINKIEQLNSRARDISIYTLLSLFKHPDADLFVLIDACLAICKIIQTSITF